MNALSPSFGANVHDNFYDFMCTLIHEKYHLDTPYDAGGDESEHFDYEAVLKSDAFSNVSDEYKTNAINAINLYKQIKLLKKIFAI